MIPALVNLLIVLIGVGVIYWAFTQLWPLVPFASSKIGQIVYVIVMVIFVLAVVFYGVVPVVQSLPGAMGGGMRPLT
ncbi:MAG TPA: hypothetical protein VGJ01_14710 [Pseudolabrys sp.]|jgi:hypothetical protein